MLNYTSNEAAATEAAAAVVAAGGAAVTKRFDVSDSAAVDAAFKEVVAAEGGLHILVNNAGIAVNTLVLGAKDADWKRAIDVNLNGTFYCCRAALRPLLKAQDAGRIINITVDHRRGRLGRAGALRRREGGDHRAHEDARARVRVARRDRQRRVARLHRHRHDRERAPRRTGAPSCSRPFRSGASENPRTSPPLSPIWRGRRPATSPGKSCASTVDF